MGWASLVFGVFNAGISTVGSIFGARANEQQQLSALAEQQEKNARNIKIASAIAVAMVILLVIVLVRKGK